MVDGTTADTDALRERLGSPPAASRDSKGLADSKSFGRIFNRPHKRGLWRPPLTVRRESLHLCGRVIPPPLFSGRSVFTPYVKSAPRRTRSRISLHLWLNPTRYLLHQPFSPMPNPSQRGAWPEARLFANKFRSAFRGEFAYDGNDNWIPDTQRAAALSNPARWKKHLQNYLIAVPEHFERELDRVKALLPNLIIRETERFALLAAEIYWEFESENPLDAVAKLQQPFFSFVAAHRRARFYPKLDVNVTANALSLAADVGSGEQLRIYAKGNTRVRTEVAFTLKKDGYRLKGGHTSENWNDLPRMVEKLADHAASRVNWAFAKLKNRTQVTPSGSSADDLLQEIAMHSGNRVTMKTITDFLVHSSSISAAGATKSVARACRRLSKNEVLKYRRDAGQGGNYVVTAPYRGALQELQQRRRIP